MTEIFDIICLSDIDKLKILLDEPSIDLTIVDKRGNTPLALACVIYNVDIIKLLIDEILTIYNDEDSFEIKKSLLLAMDEIGINILNYMCIKGNIDIVKILLDESCINTNLNIKDKYNYIALHAACAYGRTEIVKLLLNYDLDINLFRNFTDNPLYFACRYGHIDIVKILLDDPRIDLTVYKDKTTPADCACMYGSVEIVKLFIIDGRIPLCYKNICFVDEINELLMEDPS